MFTFECVTVGVVSRAEGEEDIIIFSLITFFFLACWNSVKKSK